MASRFAAPAVLPAVAVLPPVQPNALVSYQGAPYWCDGTTWARLGSPAVRQVVVDAGAIPTPEVTTTVAVAGLAVGTGVLAWLAPVAPGKDPDDVPMDVVDVFAYAATAGQLTVRLTGMTGHLADQFTVCYLIL